MKGYVLWQWSRSVIAEVEQMMSKIVSGVKLCEIHTNLTYKLPDKGAHM
jgi:hypothetical protein